MVDDFDVRKEFKLNQAREGQRVAGLQPMAYPPTLTPLPALELVRELQKAVILAEANSADQQAHLTLRGLQFKVLIAIARFECEMGGVL